MITPSIKKVSSNGQVVLPREYKGQHVTIQESDGGLLVKRLVWDKDLGMWLNVHDSDHRNILDSETIWGRETSTESVADFMELLDKSIASDGQ